MIRNEFLRECFAADVRAKAAHAGLKLYEVDVLCGTKFTSSMLRDDWMPTLRHYLAICDMLDLNAGD